MKRLSTAVATVLLMLVFASCASDAGKQNAAKAEQPAKSQILVAYFSCSGNTKKLAQTTAKVLGADLYEITPAEPYTTADLNYEDESSRATQEQKYDRSRPALANKNAAIEDYSTVVLAYPIWWGQAPRIIDTFVETYDFTGKTVVPICTSGGSDLGSSADYLQRIMQGKAKWKSGHRFETSASENEIKNWFDSLKN